MTPCDVQRCASRAFANVRTQRGESIMVCEQHLREVTSSLVGKPIVTPVFPPQPSEGSEG